MNQTPQPVMETHHTCREIDIALDMRVQEVVVNASTHIAVAEARARDAEMVTRATELEANGKLANMQRVMQDGLLKAQAEAQETERQKQNVELQLQQMREEAARRDLQMQQLQADTEHKLRVEARKVEELNSQKIRGSKQRQLKGACFRSYLRIRMSEMLDRCRASMRIVLCPAPQHKGQSNISLKALLAHQIGQ